MKHPFSFHLAPLVFLAVIIPFAHAADSIDFTKQVKPLLESACLSCHGAEKPKGDLRLDTRAGALKGGEKGTALVPGHCMCGLRRVLKMLG
jgi:hypothetical protein